MKAKLHFRFLGLLLIPVFYFIITIGFKGKESTTQKAILLSEDPGEKDFINLIFTDTYFGRANINDPRAIENNIKNFKDSLRFNSVHVYGYGNLGGGFDEPIDSYKVYVSGLMDSVRNSGLRGFYGRNKIEQLSYGQRLEYEAEGGNNGFSYTNNTGSVLTDSGRQIVRGCLNTAQCPEADATPRYLCQNIYENLQHGDLIDFTQADLFEWHLKPIMRIDSSVVDNNPNAKVIRIDVINYKGVKIDSIIIRAKNFIDGSGNYGGQYVDNYIFGNNFDSLQISGDSASGGLNYGMRNDPWEKWKDSCKVDFKVWWFGEVEVWFDKMIVDDRWAHNLFHPVLLTRLDYENRITEEAVEFTDNIGNGSFFIDEVTHSQIPCIKRVYELMKQSSTDAKLNFAVTNYFNIRSYKNNNIGHRELLGQINSESFSADAHEFQDILPNTLNSSLLDPHIPSSWLKTKEVYNVYLQKKFFGDKSKETGIDPIEGHWAEDSPSNWGSLVYQIELARQQRDSFSLSKKFIMQPQIHGVLKIENNYFVGGVREPLNEEIEAQAMLSIAHGAEGICWFVYYGTPTNFKSGTYKIYGLLNLDSPYVHRHSNHYGQDKWNAVRKMNIKIENWKPTLDKIDWTSGWSVHTDGASHNFISDIKSIKRNESYGYTEDYPCTFCDPSNERYWEMGFFEPDFDNPEVSSIYKSKYFIMVNRRCIPDEDNQGDFRSLRIKFDSTQLSGFTNWKIIDLDTNNVVSTFNKNTTSYINMGEFKPGEGKLYKLAPVMQEGGTLVANEDCSGEFDCKGEVNNNGYDINIRPGTTINFADSTVRILMTEGNFKSGISPSGNTPVYLKAKDGNFWKGLKLQNCPNVEIERTNFENISPFGLYSTYSVNIINCGFVNVSYCSFSAEPDLNAGGVNAVFTTDDGLDIEAYIVNNHFEADDGDIQALTILTSGYVTFPVLVEGNIFESTSGNSFNAMLFAGVEGGAVKNNSMNGYKNGIILIWSAMDFYGNTFKGSDDDSKGILLYASSYANLGETGKTRTGGSNYILSEGENARCIESDFSFLNLDIGYNKFDIMNYDPGDAFHFSGTLPDEMYADTLEATQNCFQLSGSDTDAVHNMVWQNQDPVIYNFSPYYCGDNPSENMIVFDLENGMYDTIYTESGGSGGGKSNYELRITNYENVELITIKSLEDSVSLNLRKRDYERVSDLCYELLTDHIDSLKDVSIISKLYLAELRLDSSGNRIANLKSFLETLILNNPGKESFVKQSFYVIQKCKVSLEMYESAMTGFQEIINQNPYSYEGLVASWDYAATSLISGGQGGGERDLEFGMSNLEFENSDFGIGDKSIDNKSQIQNPKFQIFNDDPNDKYDPKKFTKEERKEIKENVINSFQTSREIEIEKVKSLENKVREGNASKTERSELNVKKTLSEVIRVKKPRDITEHINNVNGNIQKVFGSTKEDNSKEVINIIPTEYSLSQNYPNPFNPVRKINFDLPQDGNVKLIIYDLLGREIMRLLNNEL